MLSFLPGPAANRALRLEDLVGHPAALFAEIRVLVLCAAVGALADNVPVRQELVVKRAVELNDALVIDMAVLDNF